MQNFKYKPNIERYVPNRNDEKNLNFKLVVGVREIKPTWEDVIYINCLICSLIPSLLNKQVNK